MKTPVVATALLLALVPAASAGPLDGVLNGASGTCDFPESIWEWLGCVGGGIVHSVAETVQNACESIFGQDACNLV